MKLLLPYIVGNKKRFFLPFYPLIFLINSQKIFFTTPATRMSTPSNMEAQRLSILISKFFYFPIKRGVKRWHPLCRLSSVVSLNSIYVAFSFLGLSLTTIGLHSIDGRLGYNANISTIRSLMLFEVISFAFFLTSSLVAHGLKIMIKLINGAESNEEFRSHFNKKSIRKVMPDSARDFEL